MFLRAVFILFYLFFTGVSLFGQNLIPNPSFEMHSIPPNYQGYPSFDTVLSGNCDYWYAVTNHTPDWTIDSILTEEIKNELTEKKINYAKDGNAYAGFIGNEPLISPLKWMLKKDSVYCIKAWVLFENGERRPRKTKSPRNTLGLAFNKNEKSFSFKSKSDASYFERLNSALKSGKHNKTATFENYLDLETTYLSNGKLLDNNTHWTEIKAVYKAKGHETVIILNQSEPFPSCYYYLDDISMYRVRRAGECELEPIKELIAPLEEVEKVLDTADKVAITEELYKVKKGTSIPQISESSLKVLERVRLEEKKENEHRKINFEHDLLKNGKISSNDILFKFNSSAISKESYSILNTIGKILVENVDVSINIIGHTDSIGEKDYHLSLSLKRSESIRDYFISRFKIEKDRLIAIGMGDEDPIETNETEEGRRANRRVEFQVLKN